jgi:CubicO group peptidase (beta-lactamase class C family)
MGRPDSKLTTVPNPDLQVVEGNKSHWTHADHRRYGWHHLHQLARYTLSFRSARVMTLEKRMDNRIAHLRSVMDLTSLPSFSAMVVLRGQHILFERYATDFGPAMPHSIQSITKTMMNLIVGRLDEQHTIDLQKPVRYYLAELGSGYANATVQQVLNMDVVNDYSGDFADPAATYYRHEEAMGWRLPRDAQREETQRHFVAGITGADSTNRTGCVQYKDANTAVLGCVVEHVSGRPLRSFLADIVDAAALEGSFHITTDREGFPTLDGGGCLSARDLARYLSLFVRGGCGVNELSVGSPGFIERTLKSGIPLPATWAPLRYSNHTMVYDRLLGHGGWGGQLALADLEAGTIGIYLSVNESQHATNPGYIEPVIRMLQEVVSLQKNG